MKFFFLHAEVEDDREMLASVLSRHFENNLIKNFAMTYIIEKDFTRVDIYDNVTFEMMKDFISEVPDGHRMIQTLATDIDEADYDWREIYFSSN
ncbi:hypothetical protein MM742_004150 [Salmonella enterica]|nr:hypothetical protein [Salmonella enterica]EGT9410043.1 hypothetical protein [Salmonella enterica]EHT7272445.1 hypothetical protein [Salmonella enterica]EIY7949526.1 hypothetical protein [Salmonella enterica]